MFDDLVLPKKEEEESKKEIKEETYTEEEIHLDWAKMIQDFQEFQKRKTKNG